MLRKDRPRHRLHQRHRAGRGLPPRGAGRERGAQRLGDTEGPKAEVASAGKAHGIRVGYHGADMSKPAEIEAMMAYAAKEFGGVDVLVNNAGIQHVANVEDFPVERWDAIIAINLSSAFHAMRLAIPAMRKKNWGRIVNIASAHGLVASAGKSAYVAAKHGIVGLTKASALELATTGVTVNAICPGWVLTPLVQKQVDARAAGRRRRRGSQAPPAGREAALAAVHHARAAGRPGGVPLLGRRRQRARVAWAVDGGWTASDALLRELNRPTAHVHHAAPCRPRPAGLVRPPPRPSPWRAPWAWARSPAARCR